MANTHDAATMTSAARLHTWFNRLVLAAILVSIYVTVWSLFGESELMEDIDIGILWFFVIEVSVRLGVRIKNAGRNFWRDKWLMFDLFVITLSLMPLGENIIALRVMRAARLAHVGRHVTHLKHHIGLFRFMSMLGRTAK